MSKKKKSKKAMVKEINERNSIEYSYNTQLMDDIYNGTIDYGAIISGDNKYSPELQNKSVIDVVANMIDINEDDQLIDESEEIDEDIIEEDDIDIIDDSNEEDAPEEIKLKEWDFLPMTSNEDEKEESMNFGMFMLDDNIIKITDSKKVLSVDLNTLDEDNWDDNTPISEKVDIFLNAILPRFYPSALFSKSVAENIFHNIVDYNDRIFKFTMDSNIVAGYYISEATLEEIEDIFETLSNSNLLRPFMEFVDTVTQSKGFNFDNISTDYLKMLFISKEYQNATNFFTEYFLEDDDTEINEETASSYEYSIIFDNLICVKKSIFDNSSTDDLSSDTDVMVKCNGEFDDITIVFDKDENIEEDKTDNNISEDVPEDEEVEISEDENTFDIIDSDEDLDIEESEEVEISEESNDKEDNSDIEINEISDDNDISSDIEEDNNDTDDDGGIPEKYQSYFDKKNRSNNNHKHNKYKNKKDDDNDWIVQQHIKNK